MCLFLVSPPHKAAHSMRVQTTVCLVSVVSQVLRGHLLNNAIN